MELLRPKQPPEVGCPIVPESFLCLHRAGCDEESAAEPVPLEQRGRNLEVVVITIVEGEAHERLRIQWGNPELSQGVGYAQHARMLREVGQLRVE